MLRWNLFLLLGVMTVTSTVLADEAAPNPPSFIIGVWYQPISSFATWKQRGINTLIGCELEGGNVTREQWCAAARQAGLFYVMKPGLDSATQKAEAADPWLLAWEQTDEPDGAGNAAPDEIIARYKQLKAVANKPILLNFDGGKMEWRPAADYERYVQGGDILAFDYYIINRGEGPDNISKIGDRIDRLTNWTDGKKRVLAFIECSDQNLRVQDWTAGNDATGTPLRTKMRGPTADEMHAQIKIALNHGASGLVYFPQAIGRNFEKFDATPPELVPVITAINAAIMAAASSGAKLDASTVPAVPMASTKPPVQDKEHIIIDGKRYRLVPDPQ